MGFFTLRDRLDNGWSIEKAFTQPVMRKRKKEDCQSGFVEEDREDEED